MPKFRKFCNSFAKFLRKFCVISTPGAHFFGSEQTYNFTQRCSDVTIFFRSERWPSKRNSFCARRAEIPEILQFFRGIFAHNLLISTPRACILESQRTMDPVESFSGVIRFAQRMLAEKNEFCARGAPKFRKICNSFVKFFARISRQSRRRTRTFSDLNKFPTAMRAAATL